ncbi:RidA family protein [Shewanella saliphila]|uniref:Reactive intermediate/imine deaminase n=1 Tax=Shewanella saliphila TaxID=2282698 RepID=A0ABQ2Q8D1_9GAMM|nr:Rid family detoxifying hydrolase [Shewanella saliphila]MCL1102855.1 Rid family detoxifying hydrolase [Shewanella saliphila]GGP61967.1 reactive intermediate/imine deaminase [Shewanella saliphila]
MKQASLNMTLLNVATVILLSSVTQTVAAQTAEQSVQFINHNNANALPFSEAVQVNNTLYLSGQIGFDNQTKQLVTGGVEAETKATLNNIKRTLNQTGYQLNDVVKCTVMLADINDFGKFNQIYQQFFSSPYPARSTFAVSGLALNAQIEIECIAAK